MCWIPFAIWPNDLPIISCRKIQPPPKMNNNRRLKTLPFFGTSSDGMYHFFDNIEN
jgi:hypothetical protein